MDDVHDNDWHEAPTLRDQILMRREEAAHEAATTAAYNLVRQFSTGATRSADTDKPDYEGYLSPLALKRFGEYMTKHRHLPDGSLRDSDNWQRGIPRDQYLKSTWRHLIDLWSHHRGHSELATESLEDSLCALMFNVQGYLHELLKARAMPGSLEGPNA